MCQDEDWGDSASSSAIKGFKKSRGRRGDIDFKGWAEKSKKRRVGVKKNIPMDNDDHEFQSQVHQDIEVSCFIESMQST